MQNQATIVEALRAVGATVVSLAPIGKGVPDLLVGFGGGTYLLEVKNRAGRGLRLTDDQARWHTGWRGHVAVVSTVAEALGVIAA